MRRGVIDTLRRGADNTFANWPLSLIRFSEVLLFGLIAVAAVIATVLPLLVSFGIHLADVHTPEEVETAMLTLLDKWVMLLWVMLGVLVMLLVFMIIHSFVEAGCAFVFVDADRAAGPQTAGPRQRYKLFSVERWMAGAKEGWWEVFWIYNLAWGAAALVLLIPLIPIAALVFALHDKPAPAIAVGCVGLVLFMLFAIVVAVVTGMWTNRSIVQWAAQRGEIRQALSTGWRAIKTDLGRHLLVALAIFVIAMAGSSFFASFSMFAAFGDSVRGTAAFNMVTLPIRLVGSLLSSAFSAVIGSWYIASYAALAVENKS